MKQSDVTTLPQLSSFGGHIVDPDGNVIVLRGFNLCTKTAQTPEQLGFGRNNAQALKDWGVSVVRLGVPWANTQPYLLHTTDASGKLQYDKLQYDTQFLDSIKRTIQLLAEFDIYTLVDFHQDAYSAPWGFGAPSWAMIAGGTNHPNHPWPINTCGGNQFVLEGKTTCIETDLNSAFDSFWQKSPVPGATKKADGEPYTLWELYGAMLLFVSDYLSDQKGNIFGYDPINEPEPGSKWTEGYKASSDPLNPFNFPNGCPSFDVDDLAAFYQQCAIPSLRLGHPEAMIWFEPNIYFDYNAPTFLPNLTDQGNVGFNFHNYDKAGSFMNPITNALDWRSRSSSNNVPILCSEFGGSQNYEDIGKVQDHNDTHGMSSIFWAWFNNARFNFAAPSSAEEATDPREMGVVQDMWQDPLVPPNVNLEMLTAVTHVYPRITAGTPSSGWSTQDGTFSFTYDNKKPNGQFGTGATRIVVPAGIYRSGFDVSAPGARVEMNDGFVDLFVESSTPTTINVQITPKLAPHQ